MDMLPAWLSQQEMQDEGFMNQYHVVADLSSFSGQSNTKNLSLVDQTFQIPENIKEMALFKRMPSYKTDENIMKKVTPSDENPNLKLDHLPDTPNTFTISFGELKPKDEVAPFNDSYDYTIATKKCPTMIRNRIQLQDHMLAERKRREKLAQRFISLSALLPELKKMDKATVLEDAANYIQELQCRVKELEEVANTKTPIMQKAISKNKSNPSRSNEDRFCSDELNNGESHSHFNPEIEVRMSQSSVLVRIYCQKNLVSLVKALSEMQKLGLSVTSSSALPFAKTTLIITIVAMKKNDFSMTSTDLVKNLQLAI